MASNFSRDPFDEWQYRIFKFVLFILFLATAYKLLDHELHITKLIRSIFGY
jgi:hypothetical protein